MNLALSSIERITGGGFMKSLSLKSILVLALALGGLTACNKNDGDSPINARGTSAGNSIIGTPGSAVGSITNSYDMTQQVKGFLSSGEGSVDQIRSVNSSNGLIFNGQVRFDNNNQFIPNQSYINMRINYLDQNNTAQSLQIGIWGSRGQITNYYSYASANLEFADDYGTVTLIGNYDQNTFVGDLYYTNNVTNSQGKLGQFRIQTCGFFNCVQ